MLPFDTFLLAVQMRNAFSSFHRPIPLRCETSQTLEHACQVVRTVSLAAESHYDTANHDSRGSRRISPRDRPAHRPP